MNTANERPELISEDGQILSQFRNKVYRILTIEAGKFHEGASVDRLPLKGAGIEIPSLIVGEKGRGRHWGVLPVQLSKENQAKWDAKEFLDIRSAALGTTRAGKLKILDRSGDIDEDHLLAVLRTPIGYRGSNNHTGDRTGESEEDYGGKIYKFKPFPGIVLEKGVIAQGDAGRMGSGDQLIALIPKNEVFRTGYGGRLYGSPSAHYYQYDGQNLLAATWDERSASDLF